MPGKWHDLVLSGGFLERELDVNEGRERLDRAVVLRVFDKVAHAGLKVGVPFEDVELVMQEGLRRVVNIKFAILRSLGGMFGYLFLLKRMCRHVKG